MEAITENSIFIINLLLLNKINRVRGAKKQGGLLLRDFFVIQIHQKGFYDEVEWVESVVHLLSLFIIFL